MSNNFPTIDKIFDDLDSYRDWCRYEGKVFKESELYNSKADRWQQYLRYQHYQRTKNKNKER